MIHDWHLWLGVLIAPVPWYILIKTLYVLGKQRKAIAEWYKGLPIVQWPAMLLIVIGCKIVRGKYCKFMNYDGRFWLSPNVSGFKAEKE